MSKNIVEKGNLDKPLILYNRTRKRADDFSAQLGEGKAVVAETINEAVAKSDIIFLCLGDDAAVNGVLNVILGEDVKGKVIVDCSTVHPDTTNANEKRVTEKGAGFVGMPGGFTAISNFRRAYKDGSIRGAGHGRCGHSDQCPRRCKGIG